MSTAGARLQSQVGPLLDKMTNSDADFRFMALDDLMKLNARENLSSLEEPFEKKMVELVLKLVKDTNSEVKSKAANCLGFLVRTVREVRMQEIMDTLVDYISSKDHALRDVASLGLKIVVGEIPADTPLAKSACDKLTPKLIAVLHDTSSSPELLMDSMDVLTDIYTRFASIISKNVGLQSQSLNGLTKMLVYPRVAVRKRSLVAIGALGSVSTSDIFTQLSKQVSAELQSSDNERTNTAIQLIGTLSRTCPRRLGRRLPEFMPRVLSNAESASKKAGSEDEDDADNDLRENALNTMTSILLRCPAEVTPFVNQSVELALKFVKYDPNYAEEMDEDEPAAIDSDDKMDEDPTQGDDEEVEEDDEDGLDDEDYSDDEDLSWKVRRASSKVLAAIISSRPELISNFSSSVAPVLVSRFKEREESVRIEILSTFNTFLVQVRNSQGRSQATEVIGAGSGVQTVNGSGPGALKRKRSSMDIDGEEKMEDSGPIGQVRSLVPSIAKALSKELTSKSNVTKISTVAVLRELIIVLRGGLEGHITLLVTSIEKALRLADSSSGPGSNLKAEALSFFRILFLLHEPSAYQTELPKLVPILTASMADKMHRNSVESFYASSQLVSSLRPVGSTSNPAFKTYLVEIYDSTLKRLLRSDSDQEIKECSIACLGTLLANAGDDLEDKYQECLPLLNDRLKSEVTRLATVKVLNEICKTNVCKGAKFDEFLNESLIEISNLLRQSNRQIKISSFVCLISILKKSGGNLSDENSKHILNELEPLLKSDVDQNLFPLELNVIELILENNKNSKSEKLIQVKILPSIYKTLESSLINGLALDSLLNFFRTLLKIDSTISEDIISNLMKSLENSKKNSNNGGGNKHIIATISKCIGAVLISARGSSVDNVINSRSKVLESKSPSQEDVYFSLLLLGEIGRFEDFSKRQKLLEKILSFYQTDSEEVKLAASFSIGNIAVGNLSMVLPVIENHIAATKDSKDKLLSLNALKELISHGSISQLQELAPKFWEPLFEVSDSKDEATRNLGSECLARLTLTDPHKYLSELRDSLKSSPSSNKRATVISAVRFTLTDTNKSYDEILKDYIVDFLSALNDEDIEVRKNSMLVFNSTVHNKPGLIKDHLDVLLPLLYKETKRNEALIRKVPMGPFFVTIDDGLDLRKNAFETMYTLLDECLAKINVPQYMSHIVVGLTDDDSIKTLCYLTLMRLADLSPLQVSQHIEEIVEPTKDRLKDLAKEKEKNKETKTKQEVEKFNQLTRSIFRALVSLERLAAQAPQFNGLISDIMRGDLGNQAQVYREVQSQFVSNPLRGRNQNGGMDFD